MPNEHEHPEHPAHPPKPGDGPITANDEIPPPDEPGGGPPG